MRRIFSILTVLVTVLLLSSCAADTSSDFALVNDGINVIQSELEGLQNEVAALDFTVDQDPVVETIRIMHTNDMHGRVFEGSYDGMGLDRVKSVVDVLRAEEPNSILVDAGDSFHGTNFVTLDEGTSMVDMMNEVGYELMTPGNHDFNYGQDRLLELRDLLEFPLISANVYKDGERVFLPYVFVELGSVRVAFFGLSTPETLYKTHPDNVVGLEFRDPVAEAKLVAEELKGQADVLVLLSHLGTDLSSAVTSMDVANAVGDLDLIIDGHSHTNPEDRQVVNGVLITSAKEYNKYLGVVDITVTNGEVTNIDAFAISKDDAAKYGSDNAVLDLANALAAEQSVLLNEVVGATTVRLDGDRVDVRAHETNLADLITDAMIWKTGSDLAITNGGGIRASIEIGDITVGDVLEVLPFGNYVMSKEITGQQVVDILNAVTMGYDGSNGSFPQIAGFSYELDSTVSEQGISNVMVDGAPIDLDATYVVATNDFLAAGGDGYPHLSDAVTEGEYGTLAEVVIEYIDYLGGTIAPTTDGRIVVK